RVGVARRVRAVRRLAVPRRDGRFDGHARAEVDAARNVCGRARRRRLALKGRASIVLVGRYGEVDRVDGVVGGRGDDAARIDGPGLESARRASVLPLRGGRGGVALRVGRGLGRALVYVEVDRKSTRLNSSHSQISY